MSRISAITLLALLLALSFCIISSHAQCFQDDWPLDSPTFIVTDGEEPADAFHQAIIGNGYLATLVGSDSVYVSGLFNGKGSNSHRARIPSPIAFSIPSAITQQSALDTQSGIFLRRLTINLEGIDGPVCIEQQWLAHRAFPSLLMHRISINTSVISTASSDLQIPIALNSGPVSPDISFTLQPPLANATNADGYAGSVFETESDTMVASKAAYVLTRLPSGSVLSVPPNAPSTTFTFLAAIRTSTDSNDPITDAAFDHAEASLIPADQLFDSHVNAWAELYSQGGIDIEMDASTTTDTLTLPRIVASSMYTILSSMRPSHSWNGALPYSISCTSLATNGPYNGHVRNSELFLFPIFLNFWPDLAQNMLDYRSQHLDTAMQRASDNGFKGSYWPFDSAVTGTEVSPDSYANLQVHVAGLISLSFINYMRIVGHNSTMLHGWIRQEAYPVLYETAEFWASRAVNDIGSTTTYSINGVVGQDTLALGTKRSDGTWTGVDNNYMTNVAAQVSLAAANEAVTILGGGIIPPQWGLIHDGLNIIVDQKSLGDTHVEYEGYLEQPISTNDAILAGYPFFSPSESTTTQQYGTVWFNDCEFYEERIAIEVPDVSSTTTWSMLATNFLSAGYQTEAGHANEWFKRSFDNYVMQPFMTWSELPAASGSPQFIAGAGSFLQTLVAGYGGWRLSASNMTLNPQFPPNVNVMTLRGFHGPDGSEFNIKFDASVDPKQPTLIIETLVGGQDGFELIMIDAQQNRYILDPSKPPVQLALQEIVILNSDSSRLYH